MVDCRPGAGAAPHELAHSAPNGGPPPPPSQDSNHHSQLNQGGGSGDMGPGSLGVPSPAARASTPASTTTLAQYGPGVQVGGMNMAAAGGGMGPALGYAPYYGGGKALGGVVWMPPPLPPPLPPPPHHVNPHVFKSVQPNGSDLPMNDIPTLRYYFNLGVECMWAAYGPPPPRHYAPRDITQDMQQMSLNERACAGAAPLERHKPPHSAPDKPPLQGKGNGQRSLLGPRFNKRGNQDGNQNANHNQNKGHNNNNNNNMANKGPNNRRNSHEVRPGPAPYGEAGGECVVEGGLVPVPYIYPPPVYPVQYYSVDNDAGMMGMMGGMGYVNYDETGEYVAPYYPPLYPAPPHPVPHHMPPAPPHHNQEHK